MKRRGLALAAALPLLALLPGACTTVTVRGATPTPVGTWTPAPTWTPAYSWTPLPTATPEGIAVTYRVGTLRIGVMATPMSDYVAPMAEVWDRLTLADIVGGSFDVTAPAGVFYLNESPTPSPVATRTPILVADPLWSTIGVFRPVLPGGLPMFRVSGFADGQTYSFAGQSSAFGALAGTRVLFGTIPYAAPVTTAPATPVAGSPFQMNWPAAGSATSYGVQIQNTSGAPVWPAGGAFAVVPAAPVTVSPGLASGVYLVFLIASDKTVNLADPMFFLTAHSSLNIVFLQVP